MEGIGRPKKLPVWFLCRRTGPKIREQGRVQNVAGRLPNRKSHFVFNRDASARLSGFAQYRWSITLSRIDHQGSNYSSAFRTSDRGFLAYNPVRYSSQTMCFCNAIRSR